MHHGSRVKLRREQPSQFLPAVVEALLAVLPRLSDVSVQEHRKDLDAAQEGVNGCEGVGVQVVVAVARPAPLVKEVEGGIKVVPVEFRSVGQGPDKDESLVLEADQLDGVAGLVGGVRPGGEVRGLELEVKLGGVGCVLDQGRDLEWGMRIEWEWRMGNGNGARKMLTCPLGFCMKTKITLCPFSGPEMATGLEVRGKVVFAFGEDLWWRERELVSCGAHYMLNG